MALEFRLRDMIRPPGKILEEADLRAGMVVLDFGCGPGSFSLAAARRVGHQGRVYALDIHPLAIRSVQRAAARQGLGNLRTILGSSITGLGSNSIDRILLYDVLHDIPEPRLALKDIRRVLKSDGVLSVSDHHLSEEVLIATITADGLFGLTGHGRWTYRFEGTSAGEVPP
jgi:ubiquinone/menaquinone biosynthesis C-methylase UbiE